MVAFGEDGRVPSSPFAMASPVTWARALSACGGVPAARAVPAEHSSAVTAKVSTGCHRRTEITTVMGGPLGRETVLAMLAVGRAGVE